MKISMQVHCCHVSNEQSASISLGQHKGAGCQIHTNEEPLEAFNEFFLCGGVIWAVNDMTLCLQGRMQSCMHWIAELQTACLQTQTA